jgi:Fe-S-cluster containining protein
MTPLQVLHKEIDDRVQAIRARHPGWLCGKGCDGCCRRLADIPRLTSAEWALLRSGLTQLPEVQQAGISREVAVLATATTRPVVCPMLDRATGACPVYALRPVACRSYGFYAQRDKGLYCGDIEKGVPDGTLADVVWGNHDAIDRQLAACGESRLLTEWFAIDGPERFIGHSSAGIPAAVL